MLILLLIPAIIALPSCPSTCTDSYDPLSPSVKTCPIGATMTKCIDDLNASQIVKNTLFYQNNFKNWLAEQTRANEAAVAQKQQFTVYTALSQAVSIQTQLDKINSELDELNSSLSIVEKRKAITENYIETSKYRLKAVLKEKEFVKTLKNVGDGLSSFFYDSLETDKASKISKLYEIDNFYYGPEHENSFRYEYQGYLKVPYDGEFSFTTVSNCRVELRINKNRVLSKPSYLDSPRLRQSSKPVELKGLTLHKFYLEYTFIKGQCKPLKFMKIVWESRLMEPEILDVRHLYSLYNYDKILKIRISYGEVGVLEDNSQFFVDDDSLLVQDLPKELAKVSTNYFYRSDFMKSYENRANKENFGFRINFNCRVLVFFSKKQGGMPFKYEYNEFKESDLKLTVVEKSKDEPNRVERLTAVELLFESGFHYFEVINSNPFLLAFIPVASNCEGNRILADRYFEVTINQKDYDGKDKYSMEENVILFKFKELTKVAKVKYFKPQDEYSRVTRISVKTAVNKEKTEIKEVDETIEVSSGNYVSYFVIEVEESVGDVFWGGKFRVEGVVC